MDLPELEKSQRCLVLRQPQCHFFSFQFKRLNVQLGTPDCHHVELLLKQRPHVFSLVCFIYYFM